MIYLQIISEKSYFDLTPDEHEALAQQAVKEAIAARLAKGLPVAKVDA